MCFWTEDADGNWNTGCGECFVFTEGSPVQNKFSFCPFCGQKIWEVPYTEPQEEDSNVTSKEG